MNLFRNLYSDEIEVRAAREVGQNKDKVELLIYQDARVAQNLLDETFGAFNWACQYKEENGIVFCGIALKDKETGLWVWKWNAGGEGNFEREKAVASDSFKRAAVQWGLGRELYTAPKIIVPGTKYDSFKVASIGYADNKISDLVITCKGRVVFNYQNFNVMSTASAKSEDNLTLLKAFCREQLDNQLASEKVLTKFYNFYADKIGSWQNTPNFERLLDKWITNEY